MLLCIKKIPKLCQRTSRNDQQFDQRVRTQTQLKQELVALLIIINKHDEKDILRTLLFTISSAQSTGLEIYLRKEAKDTSRNNKLPKVAADGR